MSARETWLVYHLPKTIVKVAGTAVLSVNPNGAELIFNYRSEETVPWDDDELKADHGYSTVYPKQDGEVRVEF